METTIIKTLIKKIEKILGMKIKKYSFKCLDYKSDIWILAIESDANLTSFNKVELAIEIMNKIEWPANYG